MEQIFRQLDQPTSVLLVGLIVPVVYHIGQWKSPNLVNDGSSHVLNTVYSMSE